MRGLHVWAGVSILVLVVGVLAWLLLAPGWAIALVEARAERTLGREMTVSGGAHLEFSPALAIRLDGVSLAGPEGSEDAFIKAESLRVPVSISGLLARKADLSRMTLVNPQVVLAINEIGKTSWPDTPGSEAAALSVYLDNAEIRFFDSRSGQAFVLRDAKLDVDVSELGELSLAGTASINGQHTQLQAFAKSVARISEAGSPAELNLTAPALSLTFNGRLTTASNVGLAGTVSVSGPDLRAALRWTGAAAGGSLGLKSFTLAGPLDASGRAFGVQAADFTLDGVAGKGDLTLDYRGEVPKLQALFAAEEIDLDRYIPSAGASDVDWGTAPLNFAALRGIEGAVTFEAKSLRYGGVSLGPSKVAAKLAAGRLEAQILSGATSFITATLDGAGAIDGLSISYEGRDIDAMKLFQPIAGMAWLDGKGRFSINVAGTGRTQQELVSTLKGEAGIALSGGALKGIDIATALAAVSREMQDGWPGAGTGSTPFNTLDANFTISDGIASMAALKLDAPALSMTGTGEIDLLRRALDLRVDPRLKTGAAGETVGLPVAIVVKGPLKAPRIHPDMADIVANPKAAYDLLKALGLPQFPGGAGGN